MPDTVILLIVAANLASLYYAVFWLSKPDSIRRSFFKIFPMCVLLLAATLSGLSPTILLALILCLIGDYFLSVEGDRNFLLGLGSFLLAHLVYAVYFGSTIPVDLLSSREARDTAIILIALVAAVLFRLWPHLGEMHFAVISYALAIATMAFSARLAQPGTIVLLGIVLFVISDIILANDKFTPLRKTLLRKAMPYAVWLLYFSAQSLIILGLIV